MKIFTKNVLMVSIIFVSLFSFSPNSATAYGECSQYGIWATYDYAGSCQCMSGYVFGKDFLGQTQCVSGVSLCYDKYGYSSRFDSLTNSCECNSGYVFGKDSVGRTQCISADNICTDKYGYNSRYNSLSKSCECSYGYKFGTDSIGRTQCISPEDMCRDELGYSSSYNSLSNQCECDYGYFIKGGQCVHGTNACRVTHGLYSSYSNSANRCECDSGYTLDDSNQCVEKQNNVYFTLKELDTDNKKAIIKSDYDYRYYLITYNSGCYSSSFRRYLNHKIVVNLGTDFYVDTWDKIVLQDDNETCDITRKEYADSSTTLVPEEEPSYHYVPTPVVPTPPPVVKTPEITKKVITPVIKTKKQEDKTIKAISTGSAIQKNITKVTATTSSTTTLTVSKTTKDSVSKKINAWFKNLFK